MKLNIAVITRPVPHQVKAAAPLAAGLRRAGYRVRESFDRCPPEDVVSCWGWGWVKEIRQKFPNKIVLCMDHGLFHPRKQTVVTGWQGLNGFGEHPLPQDLGQRLAQIGDVVKPMRKPGPGRNLLILGQVYNDAQITEATEDYSAWLATLAAKYERDGYTVYFRAHPVQARNGNDRRYGNIGQRTNPDLTLYETLDQYKIGTVAAMNSNGLLDSLYYGVSDIRLWNRGSMLYPISRELDKVDGERQVDPDQRLNHAQRLAWAQWDPDEVGTDKWLDLHIPVLERLTNGGEHRPWHSLS